MSFVALGIGVLLAAICVRLGYCISLYSEAYKILRITIAKLYVTSHITIIGLAYDLLKPSKLLPNFFLTFIQLRIMDPDDLVRKGAFDNAYTSV